MKITLQIIGKTKTDFIRDGFKVYENRLKHYIPFEILCIPEVKNAKNLTASQLKDKEAELLLPYIGKKELTILLDEKGNEYNSMEFAAFIQKNMNLGIKNIVFLVGGAFGFSDNIHKMKLPKLSFSKMTFSHEMIRLIFIEQLYRAMTIIKNEAYHHQ